MREAWCSGRPDPESSSGFVELGRDARIVTRTYKDQGERIRNRIVIMVGSNDGMLHAFNAGIYDDTAKKFSNGTGHELFAYTPRLVLPAIKVKSFRFTSISDAV